jgi:hypothetical protein
VKAKITGDARSKLMVRDMTHSRGLVKAVLEEKYSTRRTLGYYACKMFSARRDKNASIASWGKKIDGLQRDLREAARRVCKSEEVLGAIGLINDIGKACFIQGLYNERIQTIVRSRGEFILLSQAIEISLEEESAILSAKERSPSAASGPPLRCNKCNKLGHTANKCSSSDRFPVANVKAVLSCFNCGREGHVAKDCRRRPTYRGSVGRDTNNRPICDRVSTDTQYKCSVGRDTNNRPICERVSTDTQYKCSVGRDTNHICGCVGRDARKLNRAQGKGWIRSGNDVRELSSNLTAARRNK